MSESDAEPRPSFRQRGAKGREGETAEAWERRTLERLAFAALTEQRRARRWGLLFKFLILAYLVVVLMAYWPGGLETGVADKDHTALVELDGVISTDGEARAETVIAGLRKAFEHDRTKGVILRINSPGGSAVQAGYIHDEILRLREEHPDTPLYAVIGDTCASGGYYVAVAADEIYANRASIVGSIGVVTGSFGFVEAMDKLGVERRLLTAGEHKAFFDPFSPVEASEVAHLENLLEEIHGQFIAVVEEGRGEKLSGAADLYSGLVWTGSQSRDLGLVDALGSASYVAREVIGVERVVDFTRQPDYLERFADRLGMGAARVLLQESAHRGLEAVRLR